MPAESPSIGRYEVLGSIGSGGMGTVVRARDPKIGGRVVAIKLLRDGLEDDEIRRRFLQEANAAGVLEHENIVRIFDVGEHRGQPFIAMEFVDGETLSHWIREKRSVSIVEKLRLIEQLCDGLAYAHSFDIVHRDIKPSNLIVERRRGRLKILDFGIAKLGGGDGPHTNAGALIGSFNYMSPEQIQGRPIDHRVDIFAVGAVMFELLTYEKLFPGTGYETLIRMVQADAPSLAGALAGVDPEIEPIIARAVEKDPTRRYPDMGSLRRDIASVRGRLERGERVERVADLNDERPGPPVGAHMPPAATPRASAPMRERRELQVAELLAAAKRSFDAGQFQDALELAERGAIIDPDHAALRELLLKAETAIADGRTQEAVDRANAAIAARDLDGADDWLRQAAELRPLHAGVVAAREAVARARAQAAVAALLRDARAAFEQGDFEAAIRATSAAEAHHPGSADARAIREQVERALRQRESELERARHDEARARKDAERGDAAARQAARHAARVDLVEALRGDARERFAAGNHRAAIVRCDAVLRLAPGDPEALAVRARARQALDDAEAQRLAAVIPTSAPADATQMGTVMRDAGAGRAPADGPEADHTFILRSPIDRDRAPEAVLIVTQSPDSLFLHRRVPVTPPHFVIGRDPGCHLVLPDPRATRRHAEIAYAGDDFLIRDLESVNGTYVNGRLVSREGEPLVVGAAIRIGSTVLTFAYGQDTALPDLTGSRVQGRYVIESRIRQSARAAVYAARDTNTHTRVALKLLAPALMRHPAYRAQFEREVDTVARLDHPHICRVLDSYTEAEVLPPSGSGLRLPVLCYALHDGGTLQDVIDGREPVVPARLGVWIGHIAEALHHAHEREIVHGDLKPTAVLLDATRTHCYLTDFAIAHRLAGDGGKRPIAGAPAFMAPEQWSGEAVTPAVDQFGLAAMAYYLVTGLRPFEGQENPVTRERNFANGAPRAHEEAAGRGRKDVPPAVSAVLSRALTRDPAARFASVGAFAQAFGAALQGQLRRPDPHVFLSYRRESNAGWVWAFSNALKERHGITSFMDIAPVDVAERFPGRLEQEISACDVFVCFLSKDTLQSDWVRREIAMARRHRRPMVPVVDRGFVRPPDLDDPDIAELLEYDFVQLHPDYVDEAISRLATRIRRTHGSSGPGRPPDRTRGAGAAD